MLTSPFLTELENILKNVLCEDNVEGIKYDDIDSLDKLDFIFQVERKFNVSLSKNELLNITRLEQLVDLIEDKINRIYE